MTQENIMYWAAWRGIGSCEVHARVLLQGDGCFEPSDPALAAREGAP